MKVFFEFLILFSLFGCGPRSPLLFDGGNARVSEALIRSVSYSEIKKKVFDVSCVACHGQAGNINLETYASAYSNLQGIRRTVILKNSMPKAPFKKLDPSQLELLTAWIEAGGPEKPLDGSDPGEIGPDELEPTYTSIKKHILDKKCLSCHGVGMEVARIPMNTREELIDPAFEIVIPGIPNDSGLMIVTETGARKFMPPPKSGISPVSEDEKKIIREWIERGAL